MFRHLFPAAAIAAGLAANAAAGEVWVSIDAVTRYQMPDAVGQVVLTNPSVADVQVASATELMVFGRLPGFTDIVFNDADGKRLSQVRVRVGNEQGGLLTLYNGAERYSFSCTERCEQTMVVGDGRLGDAGRLAQQSQRKRQLGAQTGGLSGEAVKVDRPQDALQVGPADPSS